LPMTITLAISFYKSLHYRATVQAVIQSRSDSSKSYYNRLQLMCNKKTSHGNFIYELIITAAFQADKH